jgi:amino acid transporter
MPATPLVEQCRRPARAEHHPGRVTAAGPATDSRPASGQSADDAVVRCVVAATTGRWGPYAYARAAFGNAWGFTNAWSYWITAWVGNAAIAVGWVLDVEHFINTGHNPVFSVLLVLVGLWIPTAINLSGVKNMGTVQVVTTIVKFVVLAFMATVGLFFIQAANYGPFNVRGGRAIAAIGGGMAIALQRPFSDAANAIFGGTWAGDVMAIAVIISGCSRNGSSGSQAPGCRRWAS